MWEHGRIDYTEPGLRIGYGLRECFSEFIVLRVSDSRQQQHEDGDSYEHRNCESGDYRNQHHRIGIHSSRVTLPLTITPGASYTANVVFTPQAVGSASGSASVVSNLASSPTVVPLSGTGVSTPIGTLNVSPASLSFGNVNVGSSASKNVTLSNSGTATVNVQSISVTGLGFSIGKATPFAVNAGQSTSVAVTFTAQTTGTANGTATFVSDAGNSPANVSLTGTGTTVTAHSVGLSWTASTSVVVGYNVYRGSQTGGPYQRLNTSLQSASGFTDSSVNSGQTYFYVVTAVDGSGNESAFSNEASALIP